MNRIITLTAALSFAVLAAHPLAAAGQTYYVSPKGDDSNSGRAPAKAWKTIAKVNAAQFAPGDQILFARGGEWHEALVASSSGAVGKPIIYGAYGQGDNPKFWGSDVLTSADFKPVAGNTYKLAMPTHVGAVLVDHKFLLPADRAGVDAKPETWFWDEGGKTIYVNTGGKDPRTDGRVYTACVRVDVVNSNGKDHLVFRDLVGDETADIRDGYAFRVMGSRDVRLERCSAYRAGRHHFGTINSTQFVGQSLRAAYAMPNIPGGATFFVSFSDPSRHGDTHEWRDCSADHLENPGQGSYQIFYDHGEGLGPVLLENMTSHGGLLTVGSSAQAPIMIRGGLVEDAPLIVYGSNVHVDGLKIHGAGGVDQFGSDGLFENMELAVRINRGGTTGYGAAITVREKDARRNTFRFNTVVLDPASDDSATCLALVGKGSLTQTYGNIFWSKQTAFKNWAGQLDATDLARSDFNLFSAAVVFADKDNKSLELPAWRAQGFDVNSVAGDPLFTDPARGDYSLRRGSPALGAARIDKADRPAIDIAGRPRRGPTCSIGAFEGRGL